jgi:Reverse transcriptase (RNA-dependent DNA polymerase)/RNase H-like domain found in reverse transcriptase/Integrase zinc binding domain/Chromo (CHRromatin Organisation MOdifier) domain
MSLECKSYSFPSSSLSLFAVSSVCSPETAAQQGYVPYIPRYHPRVHIIIEVEIWDGKRWTITYAMIDSGASGNFICYTYFRFFFEQSLSKPKTTRYLLKMADGKTNVVSRETSTQIKIKDHSENLTLDITRLERYPIILGIPWLKKHDPWIHWSSHRITFNSPHCLHHCQIPRPLTITALPRYPTQAIPLVTPPKTEQTESAERNQQNVAPAPKENSSPLKYDSHPEAMAQALRKTTVEEVPDRDLVQSPSRNAPKAHRESNRTRIIAPTSKDNKPTKTVSARVRTLQAPKVSLIGPAAFSYHCKQSDVQLFQIDVSQLQEENSHETDLQNIPEEYHEFAKVFSKEEADKLPPHRPYDHKIPLQPGTTPPWGPIYSLAPEELKVLREYIDVHLRKGFIRNSQSSCSAPILFVKKPDGSLRLCVDYRGLNKITVKNRYPLPLINELFDRLRNAKRFTKLDMRDGYHRLRMAEGEEWKTAFRTRYGLFEYTVMPFGLCNAPGTFQHYVNDIFRDMLDVFMSAYLDDLLIYSKNLKEHKRHVRLVLERLAEHGLHLKATKCQFHQTEISFLGFVISEHGISMDPEKIRAITSWPIPKSVLDIQIFLGLANFYRRFIKNFSKITSPITRLLKKGVIFGWDKAANNAFKALKKAFTSAPILRHFDFDRPAVVETDSSDFGVGGLISQRDEDGVLHPVAFFSRKLLPAELNYEIYDKELLAIVDSLTTWRHYLQGSGHPVEVITDHKNLLWFTETKMYNRRQARWAEKLSHFDFVITYRPGSQNAAPDALSRRPDHRPPKREGEYKNPNEFQFLKPEQLKNFPVNEVSEMITSLSAVAITEPETSEDLFEDIKRALPDDEIGEYLPFLKDPTLERPEDAKEYLDNFTMTEDGLILKRGLIYVPNQNDIRLRLLHMHHDTAMAGHLGQEKTYELLSRNYTWPDMRQFVSKYVSSCETCARNKAPRQRPHGPLCPLPIPSAPWKSVSMDFIIELPLSHGFNAIYVCIDRLTKMAHFIPTITEVTAEETAKLYLQNVLRLHGLPSDVVSDRGTQFTCKFTRRLLELCDIKGNRSTAFHPQSDGQTERVNQVLEQYLRIFCHYQQDDWFDLLPLAEFAYNNAKHSSTLVSPFYANYGYHPRMSISTHVSQVEGSNPAAEEFVKKMERIHQDLAHNLREAQAKYKKHYDAHVKDHPQYKVGDFVWLSRKNISTTRPSAKLDFRRLGPFKILEVIGEAKAAYKLELPATMRIHPTFHVSLLTKYTPNVIPGRTQPEPPPIIVDGQEEFEVEKILDSRIRYNKLQYYVDWKGYGVNDRTWEPSSQFDHAPEAIEEYHRNFPNRPSPKDIPRRPRRSSAPRRGGTVTAQ